MARSVFPMSQFLPSLEGKHAGASNLVDFAQLDAFTAEPFKGNPAAVCLFPTTFAAPEWMQSVAAEFNAPMTAFLVPRIPTPNYDIRFFTTMAEIDLCGHATLASAYLLFKSGLVIGTHVVFHTQSTTLTVNKVGEDWQGQVELNFSFADSVAVAMDAETVFPRTLQSCKGKAVSIHRSAWDRLIIELPSAVDVEQLQPCFEELSASSRGGVIVTGKGAAQSPFDFVSRFFAPAVGINEDPVCGTAHCALAPMWAEKLGKTTMVAYQASKRGGVLELFVDREARRVLLRGTAVIVSTGVLLR